MHQYEELEGRPEKEIFNPQSSVCKKSVPVADLVLGIWILGLGTWDLGLPFFYINLPPRKPMFLHDQQNIVK
jgi:hypothetical protein